MKKTIFSAVGLLVVIALLGWYVSSPSTLASLIETVSKIGVYEFALITLGAFGFILFQGFILSHSVSPYGVKLSFMEHFGIIIVTFFSNYMIPFLGFGVRGVYLHRKHKLAYKDFIQTMIGVLAIEWAVVAVMALISVSVLFAGGQAINVLLAFLMIAILAGFVFLMVIRPGWIPSILPFSGAAKALMSDWQHYASHKETLMRVMVYTVLEVVSFAFAFVVVYKTLFPQVPVAASVFASALSDLSLIIRILPASAGSLEAALQMAMSPYGLSFNDNLSVALITRAALAVIFIPLGPFFFWWLLIKSGVRDAEKRDSAAGVEDAS